MARFRAVAFDLDGTLINSVVGIAAAIDEMLEELGLPKAGAENVSIWIGNGAKQLVERALIWSSAPSDEKAVDDAYKRFSVAYEKVMVEGSQFYPNVKETLDQLLKEGLQLAIVTNKPSQFLTELLGKLEVLGYFDLILGADDVKQKKPHPAPIFQTLGALGLYRNELLFVGDSKNDILAAKNAGVPCVGLTYGYNYGQPIEAESPTYVVDNFEDILKIVV